LQSLVEAIARLDYRRAEGLMEMIHLDLLDFNEVGFSSSAMALRFLKTQLT
jgi:hypothetical protein